MWTWEVYLPGEHRFDQTRWPPTERPLTGSTARRVSDAFQ